jgi:hypothetical protein
MIKVKQKFEVKEITNVEEVVDREMNQEKIKSLIKPGMKIAVAVGSRGICNLDRIVKRVIDDIKMIGGEPFIVPAMGSHGGATAEGQKDILYNYGINEEKMGVEVISCMDVVEVGKTEDGVPVYVDKTAYEADMIVPVGRVKVHTDFKGPIESGMCKMLAIGLGKHKGCSTLHSQGFVSFPKLIPEVGEIILNNSKVGFGVAIVENAHDTTAEIKVLVASEIMTEEPKLLEKSKKWMPKIMIPEIDVLIVEKIGKDISGGGMDPNITGRTTRGIIDGFTGPKIQRIVVLGLTEHTHGNATGIGLADFTTKEVVDQIDYIALYANTIASGNPEAGRIPIALDTEREAIIAGISCCTKIDKNNPKIVRIKDTLSLENIWVSENLLDIISKEENLIIEG